MGRVCGNNAEIASSTNSCGTGLRCLMWSRVSSGGRDDILRRGFDIELMIQANCLVRRDAAAAIDFRHVTLATRPSAATPETESRKACRGSSDPLLPTQATRIAIVNTSSSSKAEAGSGTSVANATECQRSKTAAGGAAASAAGGTIAAKTRSAAAAIAGKAAAAPAEVVGRARGYQRMRKSRG
jgi:hypothetical protein